MKQYYNYINVATLILYNYSETKYHASFSISETNTTPVPRLSSAVAHLCDGRKRLYYSISISRAPLFARTLETKPWQQRKVSRDFSNVRTWMAPSRDSACRDFRASAPTKGWHRRNRCNIRRNQSPVPRCLPVRTAICIGVPTAPSTSSSSRDLATGTPACTRIYKPRSRPPKLRTAP